MHYYNDINFAVKPIKDSDAYLIGLFAVNTNHDIYLNLISLVIDSKELKNLKKKVGKAEHYNLVDGNITVNISYYCETAIITFSDEEGTTVYEEVIDSLYDKIRTVMHRNK